MNKDARRRAAQYLRMSTEHQNYSLDYQAAHNAAFALQHDLELVASYVDAGISGLRLTGRDGLKQLLADILSGKAPFQVVLVYDVSRWGRFQDVDQGAHYEFICREAGVQIIYTAEPFANDDTLSAAIVKQVKRAMAAEYSRELSSKVARAQGGLALEGFWTNGPPGYGLRRYAVTRQKRPRFPMKTGEQKGLRGYRTILVHGPPEEVATVRRIYSLFLVAGMKPLTIARLLNGEGVPAEGGRRWSTRRIRTVLRNEKYAGAFQRNKSRFFLGSRHRRPPEEWIRVPAAVDPIVDKETFDAVQGQFRKRKTSNPTDAELLEELRIVLRDHGRISNSLITAHPETHCSTVITQRFGGLVNAMRLIGAQPSYQQLVALEKARRLRPDRFRRHGQAITEEAAFAALKVHYETRGYVSSETIDEDVGLPSSQWYRGHFGGMARIYGLLGHVPTREQCRNLKPAASPEGKT